jgi:putative restriction endonuclease
MRTGKQWSRDELLLALNLYLRIPFGRQHKGNPAVIELANMVGRTPSSIAMKICNFTSLDPDEKERGINGLSGASEADKSIWREFNSDRGKVTIESEAIWEKMSNPDQRTQKDSRQKELPPDIDYEPPEGPTAKESTVQVRLAQNFFRKTILSLYGGSCCITGISIPQLLIGDCGVGPNQVVVDYSANDKIWLFISLKYSFSFSKRGV